MAIRTATPICVLVALLAACAADASAAAKPHLSWVRCYRICTDKKTVAPGGTVKIAGRRLGPGMRVVFKAKNSSRKRTVKTQVVGSTRLLAAVPSNARSGHIYVRGKHGVRTNATGPIRVKPKPAPGASGGGSPSGTAFDGTAMWIWNMPKTQGGDPNAIVAQAQAHDVRTVFVKSGDGTNYWSQFSPQLVQALKAGGLKVCAWQYVYGSDPNGEALVAAQAVQNGADCFVIDAESEYQGRYAQAQTYINALRAAVGASYPIGLSSFPYVDFHPGEPYSEFMRPNGAQFNVPQVYWKTIGDSVDTAMDHTYRFNRPYARAIAPAGQAYDDPPPGDVFHFRQVAAAQQSPGVSWWVWESTTDPTWNAISQPLTPLTGPAPASDYAPLASGAKGDLVVWAQEHLQSAGQQVTVDGQFGPQTQTAVTNFQSANGLPATGQIDTATWQALLRYQPAPQTWAQPGSARAAKAGGVTGPSKSAGLPAIRDEIPPIGRGRQP